MNTQKAEVYADLARRYTGGEPIQIAGVVYWNVLETEEKRGGLAERATSGMRAKDLALGIALGPVGVLASVMSDKNEPAKCTCALGILAVGNRRVFLLKLGRVKMIGQSASCARLPSELVDYIPRECEAAGVIAFRPLTVATNGDELRLHVLGKPPAAFHSAFRDGGSCLVVHAPGRDTGGSFGARSIAAAVGEFATYPLPEEIITSILVADRPPFNQRMERAFADPDYVQAFVPVYKREKKEVRRAFVLAARTGPAGLKEIAAECARSVGRGPGNRFFVSALGIFFSGCGMLSVAGAVHDVARGSLSGSNSGALICGCATFIPVCLCLGFWLLYSVWWCDARERRLERRLLEQDDGYGGSLDALLALVAWGKDWRARAEWNEVETQLVSSPQFGLNFCEILRGMKQEKRKAFLISVPPGVREKLIGTMLAFEGAVSPSAVVRYLAAWVPCLILGICGAARGFEPGTPFVGNWLVFTFGIFLGFGGGVPAIVLLVIQLSAWRSRLWVRRVFPADNVDRIPTTR